jgi:hypothetical protein
MDWEVWLRAAAGPPSDHEDSKRERTEKEIRDALASYVPLNDRPYVVYAKGSYANNTNVRLNYDVDIAVEYRGYFFNDQELDLDGQPDSVVGVVPTTDTYTQDEFKADILGALHAAYGTSAIEKGRIAYRVRERKTTLPADVVPSWEYRRYDRIVNGQPVYQQGSCVYPTGGARIVNYPSQQQRANNAKNSLANKRYKRMVRALKKLQTRLVQEGELSDEVASYFVECLVFNVPDDCFNHDAYLADMRAVLATIFNETRPTGGWNDWEEVHGLKWLFRGPITPSRQQAHDLASAAWDHLGFE